MKLNLFTEFIVLSLGVLFFIFKVNKCTDCHNSNGYHYNKKSFHLQSSFTGVITTANTKTNNAIADEIKSNFRLIAFSLSNVIAPMAVSRYFTRSKSRFATFSFFRKYLSFINKFKHMKAVLSNRMDETLGKLGLFVLNN